MQIRAEQLEQHLARGLKPIYTIHGDEPLLAQEAADAVRAAARQAGYAERKVFVASGAHFDWSGVLGAAQAMSLFAEKQLIEIRIPSGKPGKEGSEALQRYCSNLADDVLTIVHLPKLDWQQAKAAWFTALDAAGVSLRVETLARNALPGWLAQRLARQGQRVQPGEAGQRTLAFFADRVEGNLLAAHQETQKLALLHPAGELSFEQVEAAVLNVARYGVTKLEDIRTLARARSALDDGKPLPMALKEARVWGVKEKLFERVLPQLAGYQLAHLLAAGNVCDGIVKGLKHPEWPQEAWPALRRWVLMMLQHLPPPTGKVGRTGLRLALQG